MWDFADLSAEAKELGGPDALREAYIRIGQRIGEQRGLQLGQQLGQRLARQQGFALGVLAVGVPVAGWTVWKGYRTRRAVATAQATAVTSKAASATQEAVPAEEKAVLAQAEAVIAAAEAAPVSDEQAPEPAAEPSPDRL